MRWVWGGNPAELLAAAGRDASAAYRRAAELADDGAVAAFLRTRAAR
ncbi:hypothetical protein [Microbacterium sp. H83]|nr:hypothetical protein [Microbacterium sp. H83]